MPHTAQQVAAFHAWFWYGKGEPEAAYDWGARYKAGLSTQRQKPPPALSAFSDFIFARIQLAQGFYVEARCWLEELRTLAKAGGRWYALVEASLLLALLEQATGNSELALTYLHKALQRSHAENVTRLFLDEGQPMLQLLAYYLDARAQENGSEVAHARRLLEQGYLAETPLAFPEALTERELEILRGIAAGKANSEIADELILALSTVKWHIAHLYRKLHVNTRVQAVARARVLKLLRE